MLRTTEGVCACSVRRPAERKRQELRLRMMEKPRTDQIFRHFGGDLYRIIACGVHAVSGEEMVVYQALYGDFKVYVQELDRFLGSVDREQYPDADQDTCFRLATELVGQAAAGAGPQSLPGAAAADIGKIHGGKETEKEKTGGKETAGRKESEREEAEQEETVGKDTEIEETENTERGEIEQKTEEPPLDPFLLDFLDADTYRERLNLLAALHVRLTDEMVNTMAVSLDVEIKEGDIEERYEALKNCLLTLEKYECNRIR